MRKPPCILCTHPVPSFAAEFISFSSDYCNLMFCHQFAALELETKPINLAGWKRSEFFQMLRNLKLLDVLEDQVMTEFNVEFLKSCLTMGTSIRKDIISL